MCVCVFFLIQWKCLSWLLLCFLGTMLFSLFCSLESSLLTLRRLWGQGHHFEAHNMRGGEEWWRRGTLCAASGGNKQSSCLPLPFPFSTSYNIRLKWTKLDTRQNLKLCFISYDFLLISSVDKVVTSDLLWTCSVPWVASRRIWREAHRRVLEWMCLLWLGSVWESFNKISFSLHIISSSHVHIVMHILIIYSLVNLFTPYRSSYI